MIKPAHSLVSRLVLSFLGVSFLTVIAVGSLSYYRAKAALVSDVYDRLEATIDLKEAALDTWIDEKVGALIFIKTQPEIRENAAVLLRGGKGEKLSDAYSVLFGAFQVLHVNMPDFYEISLLSPKGGEVLVSSRLESQGDFRVSDTYFTRGLKGTYIQEIYLSPVFFKPTISIATPVYDDKGRRVGVLAGHLDLDYMDDIILRRSGLGRTGESYLVNATNTFIAGREFGRAEFPRGAHSEGIEKAIHAQNGKGLYRNYAGIPVVGAYKWIGQRQLALIAEINQKEAFQPVRTLAFQILGIGTITSLLLACIIYLVARRIASPVVAVTRAAERISEGDRVVRAPVISKDEISDLARAFNRMVDEIQESENRYRLLADNITDVIWVLSLDLKMMYVSPSTARFRGYTSEEVLAQSVEETMTPESYEKVTRALAEELLLERKPGSDPGRTRILELEFLHQEGYGIWGEVAVGFLRDREGTAIGILGATRDITERKVAEKLLKRSEERFQTIFRMSPGAVIITRVSDGTIVDVNDEFTRITGNKREDTVGKSAADLGTWKDLGEREELLEALKSSGSVKNVETGFVGPDGKDRVGLMSASIVPLEGAPHIIFVVRDITGLKNIENELRENEERLKTVFNMSPGAIAISRVRDGVVVEVNEGFSRITGYSKEETIGRNSQEVGIWEDQSGRDRFVQKVLENGSLENFEFQFNARDGGKMTGLVSAAVVQLGGEPHLLFGAQNITEIKAAEEALIQSEEKYRLLAENVSDVIWVWDRNLKPVYYSPSIYHLRGVTPEEALEQPLEEFLTPNSLATVHRMLDREVEKEIASDPYRPSPSLTMELEMRRKDGSKIWVEVNCSIMTDEEGTVNGVIGVTRDISRRKMAEKALRESEERYRILFSAGSDAVFVLGIGRDGELGEFYNVNDVACRMLGYSRAEMLQMSIADFGTESDHSGLVRGLAGVLEKEKVVFETELLAADGTPVPVEISAHLFKFYESLTVMAVARDLTERRRTDEERRLIQTKLIQANKMTSLGLMVSSIAHEINNPNNTIMFNLRRFARSWDAILPILDRYYGESGDFNVGGMPYSDLRDVLPKLVAGTLESSEMIKAIIENLKAFVRHSTDAMDFDVDVSDEVQRAVNLIKSQVRKGVGKLETDLSDKLPRIKGNPQKIVQVVINLVSNALESLTDKSQKVLVRTGSGDSRGEVFLEVEDEGRGMTPEQVLKATEPFFTTRLEAGGTGLGLTITKMLIDEHGGQLDICSEPGKGTTMKVTLKVDREARANGKA